MDKKAQNVFFLTDCSLLKFGSFLPSFPTSLDGACPTDWHVCQKLIYGFDKNISVLQNSCLPLDQYQCNATRLLSAPFLVGFLRGAHQLPVAGHTAKVPAHWKKIKKFHLEGKTGYCEKIASRIMNVGGVRNTKEVICQFYIWISFHCGWFHLQYYPSSTNHHSDGKNPQEKSEKELILISIMKKIHDLEDKDLSSTIATNFQSSFTLFDSSSSFVNSAMYLCHKFE